MKKFKQSVTRWYYKTFKKNICYQMIFDEEIFIYGDITVGPEGNRSKCIGKGYYILLPNK